MTGRTYNLNREAILKFNRLITGFILGALMAAFTQANAQEDNSEQGWKFTAKAYVWGQSIGEKLHQERILISASAIYGKI